MEGGSAFMKRIAGLSLQEREKEIYKALVTGNMPQFLMKSVTITDELPDAAGVLHKVEYQVLPDYLAFGTETDFCRIPMSPNTAQQLSDDFGASLITALVSDRIFEKAAIKLIPFSYLPVGNANESVSKFVEHNSEIEKQFKEAGGKHGDLVAGIKKDVIISARIALQPAKVAIYGWHKPEGKPIQPVYSGHVNWYVDYSHGIRLMNKIVLIDGKPRVIDDILKDPVLFRLFSNEESPMTITKYPLPLPEYSSERMETP